jgi:hypothetical protein
MLGTLQTYARPPETQSFFLSEDLRDTRVICNDLGGGQCVAEWDNFRS